MLAIGERHVPLELGNWVVIEGQAEGSEPDDVSHDDAASAPAHKHLYHFAVNFVFDRLSVPFAILSLLLSGTIGAFASQYVHREPGFNRFFVLYAIFVLGMTVTSLAGTIETLFTGWELVGLSSALLVAFYQERPAPPRNALWVWVVYRVSDASLLLAAVVMHHLRGEGDFDRLLGFWLLAGRILEAGYATCAGRGAVAAGGRGRQVGPRPLLGLAAARHGRADSVQRRFLRRVVGAPGHIPVALRIGPLLDLSPWLSAAVVVLWTGDRDRGSHGRERADRHQIGPLVRFAGPSRDYRG